MNGGNSGATAPRWHLLSAQLQVVLHYGQSVASPTDRALIRHLSQNSEKQHEPAEPKPSRAIYSGTVPRTLLKSKSLI